MRLPIGYALSRLAASRGGEACSSDETGEIGDDLRARCARPSLRRQLALAL